MTIGNTITPTDSGAPIAGAHMPAGVTTTTGDIPIIGEIPTTTAIMAITAGTIPGTIGDTAGRIPITIAIPIMVGAMGVRITDTLTPELIPTG